MKAKSIKGISPAEIKEELIRSMADGFSPTLAITFLSVKQDYGALVNILEQANLAVFGATSNGEFIDGDYRQGSIAILLLDVNPDYLMIGFREVGKGREIEMAKSLAVAAKDRYSDPAILISASSLTLNIEDLVDGFLQVIGPGLNMLGGMAGDDHTFTEQVVFTNRWSSDHGVITLVFDQSKIQLTGKAIHGWKAVGTDKTVTSSEGNRVYTIDHVPTLDLLLKYSGYSIDQPGLEIELVTNCPVQLQRDSGQPLMRPLYNIDWKDHSMLASGKLPIGSKIRFSLPPDFDSIQEVIDASQQLKREEMEQADAVLIFNCGGRLLSFGPLIGEEIKGIQETWNVPMAGMFSNVEIGRADGGNVEMHNLTTCIVALKEK